MQFFMNLYKNNSAIYYLTVKNYTLRKNYLGKKNYSLMNFIKSFLQNY